MIYEVNIKVNSTESYFVEANSHEEAKEKALDQYWKESAFERRSLSFCRAKRVDEVNVEAINE